MVKGLEDKFVNAEAHASKFEEQLLQAWDIGSFGWFLLGQDMKVRVAALVRKLKALEAATGNVKTPADVGILSRVRVIGGNLLSWLWTLIKEAIEDHLSLHVSSQAAVEKLWSNVEDAIQEEALRA